MRLKHEGLKHKSIKANNKIIKAFMLISEWWLKGSAAAVGGAWVRKPRSIGEIHEYDVYEFVH